MINKVSKNEQRKKRKYRAAKKIVGCSDHPRLNVFKSGIHVYAQLIDDYAGKTIVSASSLEKDVKDKAKKQIEKAKLVGNVIAERAINAGVKSVSFDRAGYKYHGVIAAIADGAREKGLEF